MPSTYALKLASVAEDLHSTFHLQHETDPGLTKAIKSFWADVGEAFPGVSVPWSAVFVSACVKRAGATKAEFKFAAAHSVFVNQAIKNADSNTGVFRGREITAHAPQIGDIIQNNRSGNTFTFKDARKKTDYPSHSAIVVETGTDSGGGFALTIGGNESDSIRQTIVRLDKNGMIKQVGSRFICVIETLK
jgi:hypothetical protein